MHDKSYLLYSDESYFDLVTACAKSIRQFSDLPILIYMLNSDKAVDLPNTFTIKWIVPELIPIEERKHYIDRFDDNIYKLLIERPSIAKNALLFYSKTIAYIDSDSIATRYIDRIFEFYPEEKEYPYFVEGVYDYLHINGRGGADSRDDLSTTLEHPACVLFGVNQYVRQRYRQTGYFVAGQNTIGFLEEWYAMCKHPEVISNFKHYAPYHEETIANVLLWKNLQLNGLPAIYINGYKNVEFTGEARIIENWLRVPANKEDLLFFHGIKNIEEIYQIMHNLKKMKILFIAPHLSTGGMPQFLLKRIEVLKQFIDAEIHVVEYAFYGDAYVVQRNSIKQLIGENFSAHFSTKIEIADYIKIINPDIIHIDEMSERLDHNLIKLIYNPKRTYRVVETCHDVAFKPDEEKIFHPDLYAFCTPYHEDTFVNMESKFVTIEYPIENKKPTLTEKTNARLKLKFEGINVINVGLWTSGKNQGEGIEIARKYPEMTFHFIGNQASNFSEYWEPLMKILPKNVKVWGERNDISTFLQAADIFMFNSTWECNPLALREAISYGLPIIARNLPQYKDMFTKYLNPIDTDLRSLNLNPKYEISGGDLKEFALKHQSAYEKILKTKTQSSAKIIQHYVGNPFLEIKGKVDSEFKVKFFDEKNVCQYENIIKANHWIKLNRQWFTKWKTLVYEDNQLIYENELNLNNKRVYISIDSRSLGDTIAWIHYCKIFKEKHNCEVVVSTFWNHILDYTDLELVEPGERVNCYAMYQIGWFYDENKEPELCNTIPLQKAATNILGLEFKETRPQIKYEKKTYLTEKYITIATNSTAGCKFWTREGWQELINHFTKEGYKIINVSKERNPFDNCYQIEDTSIEATINWIDNSEFFIGLSSGLSWLAWALNKKVIMISNFTKADHEFTDCIRITNTNVCHGCWNDASIKFDKGDYLWCPLNKNTERHFECQKSITAQMVIDFINRNTIF